MVGIYSLQQGSSRQVFDMLTGSPFYWVPAVNPFVTLFAVQSYRWAVMRLIGLTPSLAEVGPMGSMFFGSNSHH
jgi:hypothetical protein